MAGEQTETSPGGPGSAGAVAPLSVGAPDLTAAQVASAREVWVAAGLDSVAFDEAAKGDGHDLSAVPTPEVAQHHADFNLPINPVPSDLRPIYHEALRMQMTPAGDNENRQFAASMGFNPEIGTSIIERISEITTSISQV